MFINAVLLALWSVLPLLIVCYVRQSLIARRMRPTFALRKSETDELDRAYRLFGRVCERIKKVRQHAEPTTGFRRFLAALLPVAAAANADEMDDLYAHAQHLQATIRRLTRLPLQRLGHWIQVRSSRFACGVAVAVHVAALALFAPFHVFERSAWAQQLITSANRRRLVSLRRTDISSQRSRYGMCLHSRLAFLLRSASGTSSGLQP
jgi:hypothetical protein